MKNNERQPWWELIGVWVRSMLWCNAGKDNEFTIIILPHFPEITLTVTLLELGERHWMTTDRVGKRVWSLWCCVDCRKAREFQISLFRTKICTIYATKNWIQSCQGSSMFNYPLSQTPYNPIIFSIILSTIYGITTQFGTRMWHVFSYFFSTIYHWALPRNSSKAPQARKLVQ